MEKSTMDVELEVETLCEGVGALNYALSLMREEVDRSVVVLANAAENREAVRELTSYVEELRAELAKKDETIASLRKELAQANPSSQQGKLEPNSNPRFMTSSDTALPTKPTNTPAVDVELGKRKRNDEGTSLGEDAIPDDRTGCEMPELGEVDARKLFLHHVARGNVARGKRYANEDNVVMDQCIARCRFRKSDFGRARHKVIIIFRWP